MASDIKILDEHIPDGPTAQKGSSISYSARFFLNRGDEVTPDFKSIEMYGDAVPTIVVTAGVPFGTPGATNVLRIAWVEE